YNLVDRAINAFVAPTAGTYYLRVRGAAVADYTLVVSRDADIDLGKASDANGMPILTRSNDGTRYVLSHVGQGGGGGSVRVGYYTDLNPNSNGPVAPIQRAGYTPVRINDFATFNFADIDILMLDESNNGPPTPPVANRLPAVRSWVESGGIFMV